MEKITYLSPPQMFGGGLKIKVRYEINSKIADAWVSCHRRPIQPYDIILGEFPKKLQKLWE